MEEHSWEIVKVGCQGHTCITSVHISYEDLVTVSHLMKREAGICCLAMCLRTKGNLRANI